MILIFIVCIAIAAEVSMVAFIPLALLYVTWLPPERVLVLLAIVMVLLTLIELVGTVEYVRRLSDDVG